MTTRWSSSHLLQPPDYSRPLPGACWPCSHTLHLLSRGLKLPAAVSWPVRGPDGPYEGPWVEQPGPPSDADGQLSAGLRRLGALPMLLRGDAVVHQEKVIHPQSKHENAADAPGSCDRDEHSREDSAGVHRGKREIVPLRVASLDPQQVPHQRRNHHHRQKAHGRREAHEEKVVPLAYAIVNEGAVVIEAEHAIVAVWAVRCPWWPHNLAGAAPSVALHP
mmetsp:Transcript_74384/g.207855  ORF Transcript_74384/g.207855 Transcript_74384/m.207855 type:complete len:220 (+) Transcript_74384:174-833(+)